MYEPQDFTHLKSRSNLLASDFQSIVLKIVFNRFGYRTMIEARFSNILTVRARYIKTTPLAFSVSFML